MYHENSSPHSLEPVELAEDLVVVGHEGDHGTIGDALIGSLESVDEVRDHSGAVVGVFEDRDQLAPAEEADERGDGLGLTGVAEGGADEVGGARGGEEWGGGGEGDDRSLRLVTKLGHEFGLD